MNKLGVITKNPQTYFIQRLIKEVGQVILFNPWDGGMLPDSELLLVRTSGVYGDDRDLDLLSNYTGKMINPLSALQIFRDKARQFEWMQSYQIPVIPWQDMRKGEVKLYPKTLVKPIRGQGGWGIKVLTPSEFQLWKSEDTSYLIQPYLEGFTEYRLFFVAKDFRLSLQRLSSKGEVANFAQGGHAKLSKLPFFVEEICERLISLSGAHYGAIDLMVKGDEVYVLELNVVPGIEQLENISGENIIKRILMPLKY